MASLKNKRSLLLSTSRVVPVGPAGPPISDLPPGVSEVEFERAWVFLAPSVARSGEHTQSSVLAALRRSKRPIKLWVTDECAGITTITKHPSGLVTGTMWLLGGKLEAILALFPAMEEWMRQNGASESRIIGRPGWEKVTGYKAFRTAIRKVLRP